MKNMWRAGLAGVALWLAAAGAGSASEAAGLLAAAEAALAAGRAPEAEALYLRTLAADSDLLPAYLGLVDALTAQAREDEAFDVLVRLGEGLLRAGVYGSAREALARAVALRPESGAAHALLGRALCQEQRYAAAVPHLERAAASGAGGLQTLLYLGAAQWENGDLDAAEAAYRRAADGGAGPALHQLGRLLHWRGRAAEAVAVLERGAAAAPAPDVQLDYARALAAAGEDTRAVAAFAQAVALAPERAHARYGLALALARLGDAAAAREQLARYAELYAREQEAVRAQELARARLDAGRELLRQGQAAEAAAIFASLPATADALAGLAAAHAAAGDTASAVAALERAVTLAPERGALRLELAATRLRLAEGE